MCTLSWLKHDDGYEVFFNRDELNTRGAEKSPQVHLAGNVQYLAPTDSDGGGTWIASNQYGLTLCLVNFYTGESFDPRGHLSRGMIVPQLMSCETLADVQAQIQSWDLKQFRPFRLTGLSLHEPVWLAAWDGHHLNINAQADDMRPVVSSSFQTRDVEASRRNYFLQIFQNTTLDSAVLDAYHHSRYPELSAYSVCMKRPDARTVSFCRVAVTPSKIEFVYEPEPTQSAHRINWKMDVSVSSKRESA